MKDNQNYVIKLEQPEFTWEEVGKSLALTAGLMAVTGFGISYLFQTIERYEGKDKAEDMDLKDLEKMITGPKWNNLSPTEKMVLLTELQKRKLLEEAA